MAKRPMRELPRNGREWSAFVLPAPPTADALGPMILLLVREEETGLMMKPRVVPGGRAEELAGALLGLALDAGTPGLEPGRPALVHFNRPSQLAVLRATLASFEIDADDRADDAGLEELMHSLEEMGFGALRPPEVDMTRADWRLVDQRLTRRLLTDQRVKDKAFEERPIARYFGDAEWAREWMSTPAGQMASVAYFEWFTMEYRAVDGEKRRSKTVAEAILAEDSLDEREWTLLEARSTAPLVPVRIVGVEVGASIEVESLLSGLRTTLCDRALSRSAEEGLGLLLRLYEVDGEAFASIAGPPLTPFRTMRLLDELEAVGLEIGDEAVHGDAARLGALWAPTQSGDLPTLQNTDGDPLEWLTGVFEVAPDSNLDAALTALPGVEQDGIDEWVWLVEQPGKRGFENGTVFARMQHIGGELLVDVNSRRRMDRAREHLSAVDGLTFASVGAPAPSELGSPPPQPNDPEARAALQEALREHQMGWLDERIPALEGMTPRDAYADPAMRAKVERLIRTMPDAGSPYGPIPAPREELLAELRR